jgi:hypothetical protein
VGRDIDGRCSGAAEQRGERSPVSQRERRSKRITSGLSGDSIK